MEKSTESLNCETAAHMQFKLAADKLNLDPELQEWLLTPVREISISMPVRMDDGSLKMIQGYRVQHNKVRGPHKGGLRYHPDVTIEDVRGLAAWMTWKCALMGIPLGGAKGGVSCEPKEMSESELERVTRKYTQGIAELIGPSLDIPAPDVNTNAQVMAWMMDEYSKRAGYSPAVVTGKPLEIGGSKGRTEATGRGVSMIVEKHAKDAETPLEDMSVVIQGFGNVGYYAAYFLQKLGCRILAVSDSKAGIIDENGLDVEAVFNYKKEHGRIDGYVGAKTVKPEKVLELKCDYLIPAALENAIHRGNYQNIKARVVVEAANGPTCPMIETKLLDRGVVILPDILVNAGGVTVSYFEWVQNLQQFQWAEQHIHDQLHSTMMYAYNSVVSLVEKEEVSHRTAAYMIAIRKVADAAIMRGTY